MATKKDTYTVYRDAETGGYVSKEYALANPKTTVSEQVEKQSQQAWMRTNEDGTTSRIVLDIEEGYVRLPLASAHMLLEMGQYAPEYAAVDGQAALQAEADAEQERLFAEMTPEQRAVARAEDAREKGKDKA